ncbi:MAG TPA: P-II family nitrogen regulator [Verrucomicrobiae bacterium]|jgi:nitrogen regulatory protein P-II 1|nr:P-II family nitrogen regulator [Verrucomicrobiae bacterium]
MKKIECIIPHNKFAELEKALRLKGISGMTVYDVKGFGNEQTRPEPYLFLPKIKIEMYCTDEELEDILGVIQNICKTGKLGAGKIAVFEMTDLIRVRTGERGAVAV